MIEKTWVHVPSGSLSIYGDNDLQLLLCPMSQAATENLTMSQTMTRSPSTSASLYQKWAQSPRTSLWKCLSMCQVGEVGEAWRHEAWKGFGPVLQHWFLSRKVAFRHYMSDLKREQSRRLLPSNLCHSRIEVSPDSWERKQGSPYSCQRSSCLEISVPLTPAVGHVLKGSPALCLQGMCRSTGALTLGSEE